MVEALDNQSDKVIAGADSGHAVRVAPSLPSWGQKERVAFIADRLLGLSGYVRIDDLAALLYVSSRQISKDLVLVRKQLDAYGISIRSVPHHGMIAEGNEFDKRLCLSDLYEGNLEYILALDRLESAERAMDGHRLKPCEKRLAEESALFTIRVIRDSLLDVSSELDFEISDVVYENLVVHLYIALERAKRGLSIGEMPRFDQNDKAYMVAEEIANRLKQRLGTELSSDERRYIAIHLKGKQSVGAAQQLDIAPEVGDAVVDVLERIDARYGTELGGDFQLRMNLNMHFEPMLHRIKTGLKQPNPMIEEIKRSYIYEFELAQEGCKVIEERTGCPVSENELGYVALYLRASIEKRFSSRRSVILLVCSTGRGSAELMRARFETAFAPYIARLDCCSARDIECKDLDSYDYIFTTIPLKVGTSVPVMRVSCFLDGKDMADIGGVLRNPEYGGLFEKYFSEDLFVPMLSASTKEDALRQMVEKIKAVHAIPDGFMESVLKRESAANTAFGNNVAFPHPDTPLTEETFVCAAVLDKPIEWVPDRFVRLILLASIEDAPRKYLQPLYGFLANIMGSDEGVKSVIRKRTFKALKAAAIEG